MSALPTGTVTFLFGDVEGSTRLLLSSQYHEDVSAGNTFLASDRRTTADIARATVFRHFSAKEEIVFANSAADEAQLRSALRAHPKANEERNELAAALTGFGAALVEVAEEVVGGVHGKT